MEPDDSRYSCPRPRAVRACNSCKAHKTRCLPSARSSKCRRCEKFGTVCHFNDTHSSRDVNRHEQRSKTRNFQSDKAHSALDSFLAHIPSADLDIQYEDETENVLQLHGKVFASEENAESIESGSSSRQLDQAAMKSNKTCRRRTPHLTMNQVNRMVQSFHHRNACFPFVALPEDATAEVMCKEWPFWLLSILVVSSSGDPVLQRSLDERFRKVLATRIVMQGEKSLDYVRGILVYLAWHPTHLKPINAQISQYMQLAVAMVSDLRLERSVELTASPTSHQMMAINTVLGCYFQSTSIAMAVNRSNNFMFRPSDELLYSLMAMKHDRATQLVAYTVQLFKLIEKIHNFDLEREILKSTDQTCCPLQGTTQLYLEELIRLENSFPAYVFTNIKIQVMRRFARVKIHALALGHEKLMIHVQQMEPQSYRNILLKCSTEINSFLDYVISAPSEDYERFSFSEWAMLIQPLIIFTKLYSFPVPNVSNPDTWRDLIDAERVTYLVNTDRLCARLEDASTTRMLDVGIRNLPDLFFLLSTVMKLFKENFERESTHSPSSQVSASEHSTGRPKSQCPVMNGNLRHTEYWDLLMNNVDHVDGTNCFDAGPSADFDFDDPSYFDFSSWIDSAL